MGGDVRHFRRRLFGGFDTGDVMHYIEELAGQRNKYKTAGDKLEAELRNLNAEMKRLQTELDDADRRIMDIRVRALEDASNGVSEDKESYTIIKTEMETTTSTVCSELNKLSNTLTTLSTVLDRTNCRFAELQSAVEQEKANAIAERAARFFH